MPLSLLQAVRNNSPAAKPELWHNLPLALLRKAKCRLGVHESNPTVLLDGDARMRVDLRTGMGSSIFVYKSWEYPVTQLLKAVLHRSMCFFDIGANIGYYSVVAAARCERVYAFEPVPRLFAALCENVQLNPVVNISPHRIAMARYSRPTKFFVVNDSENQGLSSLNESAGADEITVQAQSLDDFVCEQRVERIDLMKVDVEGAEEQVFQGGAGVLRGEQAPDIIFECHPGATSDQTLREFGYRTYEFRGQRGYEARNLYASKRELPARVSALLR
jgi:FkbM family methyltransferase